MTTIYDQLSQERKDLQEKGEVPSWYTTAGWQMFKEKYQVGNATVRETFRRISSTAASHLEKHGLDVKEWEDKFFELMWNGWLSCSTPVLANMGTTRGMSVSCSGQYIRDSVDGFYDARHEAAMLTKNGFGTSGYLGDIRPRGSVISRGGKASGVIPVIKGLVQDMRDIAQGTQRRGAFASYLPIEHGDFDEVCDLILHEPDDLNIGWVVTDAFVNKLKMGDKEATRRYQKAMKAKMTMGKGYWFFVDKANRKRPACYVGNNLDIKASNLCSEIMLHSDEDVSYTCVLSSLNLALYDEWKGTDAIFTSTVFLDCVAEDFIQKGKDIKGLERAVRFTEKGRALGLGVCGFHSYVQKQGWSLEGFETHMWNLQVFKHIHEESLKASQWMAEALGTPEWCKGYGVRNTHRIACAPTKSTALMMGGVSEGINPDPMVVYRQTTAAGEVDRITPVFLELLKAKGKYEKAVLDDIREHNGSVQHLDWLTDEEKACFRTAFEIDQKNLLRLASTRAKYIDQWQSLNLFFSADEEESYVSEVHQQAFEDENILALYYNYTMTGIKAAKDVCEACQ